ncbi:hypothetical protein DFH07DRAFT_960776 [Mycena maculata]|uniref:Uncharacterized protein n=1 Tax=Mycena maculata TaxID=230809 RepID=A0AAD7IWL3_9AGAR|nr:hypothetical protein DFH07DRAFT_960776 [Mycena maculata]
MDASYLPQEYATAERIIPTLEPDIEEGLHILTRVADLLEIDDVSFSSYSSAILQLSARAQNSEKSLNLLLLVERELKSHLAAMVHEERLMDRLRLSGELATSESTSALERRREALLKNAKEHRAMLEAIVIEPPAVTFADLTARQAANERRAEAIEAKRAQLRSFRGLPPNLNLARQQLKSARAAQMALIQLRERLLGQMAEGVV